VVLRVTALRGGETREIPAAEVVPGDFILLTAGDLVPADCRLIESRDLFVNDDLLTGESYPAGINLFIYDPSPPTTEPYSAAIAARRSGSSVETSWILSAVGLIRSHAA